MAKLEWLVVRDLVEIETAAFWRDGARDRDRRAADRGDRHRGLLPAGRGARREGRLVHEHAAAAAVARQGRRAAGRLPLRPLVQLPPRAADPRAAARGSTEPRDRPLRDLTWDYPTQGEHDEPSAEAVLRGDQRLRRRGQAAVRLQGAEGRRLDSVRLLDLLRRLRRRRNQAARRKPRLGAELGRARVGAGHGPPNRRILYNRASADPDGKPWSERKRYVWWDAERGSGRRRRARLRRRRSRPTTCRPTTRRAPDAIARRPAVHHAGRRPRLAVRAERPRRRPAADALRAARVAVRQPALRAAARTRARQRSTGRENPYNPRRPSRAATCSRSCSRPTG